MLHPLPYVGYDPRDGVEEDLGLLFLEGDVVGVRVVVVVLVRVGVGEAAISEAGRSEATTGVVERNA